MTSLSKLMCGIILLLVPTIQYGGYFLLTILTGQNKMPLTDFQKAMFRAGHAHAGVLVILSLLAQLFIDKIHVNTTTEWFLRITFPLAAILVSGGFFASASGQNVISPNRAIIILYLGALLLAVSLIILGIALIKAK